eukprot:349882-Chlamydomonas_euryale.AAC.3
MTNVPPTPPAPRGLSPDARMPGVSTSVTSSKKGTAHCEPSRLRGRKAGNLDGGEAGIKQIGGRGCGVGGGLESGVRSEKGIMHCALPRRRLKGDKGEGYRAIWGVPGGV